MQPLRGQLSVFLARSPVLCGLIDVITICKNLKTVNTEKEAGMGPRMCGKKLTKAACILSSVSIFTAGSMRMEYAFKRFSDQFK